MRRSAPTRSQDRRRAVPTAREGGCTPFYALWTERAARSACSCGTPNGRHCPQRTLSFPLVSFSFARPCAALDGPFFSKQQFFFLRLSLFLLCFCCFCPSFFFAGQTQEAPETAAPCRSAEARQARLTAQGGKKKEGARRGNTRPTVVVAVVVVVTAGSLRPTAPAPSPRQQRRRRRR